eukprot:scaffold24743_cov186-Cylindrotheca_fusiformis.AAC.1
MKLILFVGALLAGTASAAFSGDTIKLDMHPGGRSPITKVDHFRIVTKPRNGYDPFIDFIEVYKTDGTCVAEKEIMDGDDVPKVYTELIMDETGRSLRSGFNIWADLQNVDVGSSFKVDYTYEGSQCKRIDNDQGYDYVEPGTYNAYMVQ